MTVKQSVHPVPIKSLNTSHRRLGGHCDMAHVPGVIVVAIDQSHNHEPASQARGAPVHGDDSSGDAASVGVDESSDVRRASRKGVRDG